jgi:hypothetical protein
MEKGSSRYFKISVPEGRSGLKIDFKKDGHAQ